MDLQLLMDNWSAWPIHPPAEAIHITHASESRALISISFPSPPQPAKQMQAKEKDLKGLELCMSR